ncbi:MAG TPA: isoprenyl transferase [Candidatus Cloacimonetes bacterium]|jgi:undecaprenyl diphosphate synthase|nr:isoprenyl transferase [Candidatus Cloacimonadota bacterium]
MSYKRLIPKLDMDRLPIHTGIIMDGNGRWAKKRFLPRLQGHNAGAKAIRQVTELGVEIGLKYLTFFAFSTENWSRPEDEVKGLLKLLKERLYEQIPELNEQNIEVGFIGSKSGLDPDYLADITSLAEMTTGNTGMRVNIAFNYGGHLEIVEAIKKLAKDKPDAIDSLTPESFANYLYTAGQPEPDLIIRTSGEQRISNFLIWQSAYSEIYFTKTLWPDFGKAEMVKAILDYQKRTRRWGGL